MMNVNVMNVKASSLKTPLPNTHENGQVRRQNAPFLRRIQKDFSGKAAAQIARAYQYLNTYLRDRLSSHLRPAEILLEHHGDALVVLSALLVPLRRHNVLTSKEIATHFGEDPARLVENVYLQAPLRTDTEAHRHEDVQTLLSSCADDLHVLLLRIGLRLAQLEHLAGQSNDQHRKIAQETLELYVPLADRLGMGLLRTRLEDLSFRLLEPSLYTELARKLQPILAEDTLCLDLLKKGIHRLLTQHRLRNTVQGRTKGLYSLYRKMCRQQRSIEAIMDRIGVRIIVPSVQACYQVLGVLHTHFRPIPGTFDDYIGSPKANGYQALHTCIYPVPQLSHKPVEIQIRTDVMHREAEFGIAAHWRYKEQGERDWRHAQHVDWLRNLQLRHEKIALHAEFLHDLHRQVFENTLVIFGSGGQQIRLPAGATVRTFAEHIGIGNISDVTACVNGIRRSLDSPLHDGDTVEFS